MYLFMDFETFSPINIKQGIKKYASHEDADIICGVFVLLDKEKNKIVTAQIEKSNTKIFPPTLENLIANCQFIIAHNLEFDLEIYEQIGIKKYNFPKILKNMKFICTKKRQDFLCQPASLKDAAKFHKLSEQKDERGKYLIQQLSIPNKAGERQYNNVLEAEMLEYCKQDVDTTVELFFEQMKFCKQFDVKNNDYAVQSLDTRINRFGIPVNLCLAENLVDVSKAQSADAQLNFCKLVDDFGAPSLTQTAALKSYIKNKLGYEIDSFDDKKQDHSNAPDKILMLLELREQCTQNSLAKANSVLENSVNNRLYNQIKYYGAHTGRWSGKDFQPQNLPKISQEDFPNDPKSYLRSVIATGKNTSLIMMDYASIEHRALFYLALKWGIHYGIECEETNQHFQGFLQGKDPYVEFAAKIYNIDATILTKKSPERTVGKVAHLGLGYGMGAEKFQWFAKQSANLDFTREEAQNIVNKYRSTYSLISSLWKFILNKIIGLVNQNEDTTFELFHGMKLIYRQKIDKNPSTNCLCLILPSGRPLFYYDLKIEAREFYGKMKDALLVGKFGMHGGLLVENIVQAFCRDIQAEHMLTMEKELKIGRITMHVHDEIVIETLDSELEHNVDIVKRTINEQKHWFSGMPIDIELSSGKYYTK